MGNVKIHKRTNEYDDKGQRAQSHKLTGEWQKEQTITLSVNNDNKFGLGLACNRTPYLECNTFSP